MMTWFKNLYRKLTLKDISSKSQSALPSSTGYARAYMEKVNAKIDKLGDDFASGKINQAQFQQLYAHYQRQLRSAHTMLADEDATLVGGLQEGESMHIRQRNIARAKAYAIYDNRSGMPLATLGKFSQDPALLVPMLSSFRSATSEIFGAGLTTTQLGEDQWLCFVPGNFTTMMALFTNEPAGLQLAYIGDLHKTFEQVNIRHLHRLPVNIDALVFPHNYFLGNWKK